MEATENESVSQEIDPILQLKRPLLPIEEYATRQGLSRGTVEEHVQSGIIQIRKYKGKTYVLDVPLSPYHHTPEGLSLLEEDPEMRTQAIEQPAQSTDSTHAKRIGDGAARLKSVSQRTRIPHSDPLRPSILSTATWTKHARKVAAVSATACLFAVIIACLWLLVNQTIHGDRLDQAYATIQTVHNNSIQTSQQLTALQNNLVESTVELQSVKNELNNARVEVTDLQNNLKRVSQTLETTGSKSPGSTAQVTELRDLLNNTRAEVQTLRSQIAQTGDSLEATKQQNAKTLEQLRAQMQRLTTLLSELATSSQTPTDSDTPDEE